MKKTIVILSILATLFWGQALRAETYTYTGPNFTEVAGAYTTSMSVTISFTTSVPIPPDQTGYEIGPLLTSWSMSDGVNTLQKGPDFYISTSLDTDSDGHIVGGWVVGTYTLSVPPTTGDIVDDIYILSSNPTLNRGNDGSVCTADDGQQCTSYDRASYGLVEAYGEWTGGGVLPVEPPVSVTSVPTLTNWALIILSMLIVLVAIANGRILR